MIFGDCPYCGDLFTLGVPGQALDTAGNPVALPAFRKEKCNACGREFWERYSRVDPQCFTLEEFAERFEIDAGGEIVDLVAKREAAREAEYEASLTPTGLEIYRAVKREMCLTAAKFMENLLLYGEAKGPAPRGLLGASFVKR